MNMLNNVNGWFGVTEYNDFVESIKNSESPSNFTGGRTQTLSKDTFGRIGVLEFFEELDYNGQILTMEELEYLDEEFEWEEISHDNTYNYNGYMERDFDFKTFESEGGTVIVFYSLHTGLDIRGGYTKSVAIQYNSKYDAMVHLDEYIYVAEAEEVTTDGERMVVTVSACPTNEFVIVSVYKHNDYAYTDILFEDETNEIDLSDREVFKETLIDFLEDAEIEFNKEDIKVK